MRPQRDPIEGRGDLHCFARTLVVYKEFVRRDSLMHLACECRIVSDPDKVACVVVCESFPELRLLGPRYPIFEGIFDAIVVRAKSVLYACFPDSPVFCAYPVLVWPLVSGVSVRVSLSFQSKGADLFAG